MFKGLVVRVWPSRLVVRYFVVFVVLAFLFTNYYLWSDWQTWDVDSYQPPSGPGVAQHPIKKLMKDARARHNEQLSRRSLDVATAAARYREARGRHPPPGFDLWFQAALDTDAVIVEDFFDRIYKDLTPFWGMDTKMVRDRAHSWPWVVRVRNGTAHGDGDTEGRVPWLQLWTGLVGEFAEGMPDVDMPINYMDEPRLLVPHNQIAKLVAKEAKERKMPDVKDVTKEYQGLAAVDEAKPKLYDPRWYGFSDSDYWSLAAKTCGPDTPAYGVKAEKDFSKPAEFPSHYKPSYVEEGYIFNWTSAMDPCEQPHLRQLHGSFVEPVSMSSTDELIPLFGGSKLPMNNEILIPGAMYLTDDEFYSGGESHGPQWHWKKTAAIWRGDASGGRAKAHTWHHFHRHRLVDMLNATTVSTAEASGKRPVTFEPPDTSIYSSSRAESKELGKWLKTFADVGFTYLCAPGQCDYLNDYYHVVERIPMKTQYTYKFLPDADGNSFSARFRGFMRSTSVPLKATIYAEWHDDRLTPWVHFIPLDNTYRDLYPVLEFFGDGPGGQGDAAARFIAEKGRIWAEQVLRREDMKLYVWRLLLEWARVCDDERHALGYVDDLLL